MIGLQHFPVVNVDDPEVHGGAVAYKEDSNGRYILVAWDDVRPLLVERLDDRFVVMQRAE